MFDAFVMQQMPYIVVVACLWFIAFTCHRFKQHDPDNVGEDSIVRQRLQGVREGGNPEKTERVRDKSYHEVHSRLSDIATELGALRRGKPGKD